MENRCTVAKEAARIRRFESRNTLSMYVAEIVTLMRPGRFSVVFYDVIKAGGGIALLQTSLVAS